MQRTWALLAAAGIAALFCRLLAPAPPVQRDRAGLSRPDAVQITVQAHDGGPFEITTIAVSKRHARGFERAPWAVDGTASRRVGNATFVTTPVSPDTVRFWVVTSDDRIVCTPVIDAGTPRHLVVTLPPPSTIRCRVLHPDGRLAPGAEVRWYRTQVAGEFLGLHLASEPRSAQPLRTNAHGVALAPATPRGRYRIDVETDGHYSTAEDIPAGGAVTLTLKPYRQSTDRSLRGTVRYADGKPAAHARLGLFPPWARSPLDWKRYTLVKRTSARGTFSVEGRFRRGTHRLLAARTHGDGRWHVLGEASVEVPSGDAEVAWDVDLGPTKIEREVSLRLSRGTAPLGDREIELEPLDGHRDGEAVRTDWMGTATFLVRTADWYLVRVPPKERWRKPQVRCIRAPTPGTTAEVELGEEARLTLQFRRPNGYSVHPASSWLSYHPSSPSVHDAHRIAVRARSDRAEERFEGLPAGYYWAFAEMQYGSRRVGPIHLRAGDHRAVEIPEYPLSRIEGRVLDRQGRGVPGVQVETWSDLYRTYADGHFYLGRSPRGPVRVRVTRGQSELASIDLEMEEGERRWLVIRLR